MRPKQLFLTLAALCLAGAAASNAPAQTPDCPCGPMDIVFAIDDTGSMGGAISDIKSGAATIIAQAVANSGNNVRFGVVSFKDSVNVDLPFTFSQANTTAAINALSPSGGGGVAEASDRAMQRIITGSSPCGSGALGAFRAGAIKIVILITDAIPGGCNDVHTAADINNANTQATNAANAGILLSAIYVPTGGGGNMNTARNVMMNYASTSSGQYREVAADGSGTCVAIEDIIGNCGGTLVDCNNNGLGDECDIATGRSTDCNNNGIPDECELAGNDCNNNGIHDDCEPDCDNNGIPDGCEPDCDNDGTPDVCEILNGAPDCNNNGIPDDCDVDSGNSNDCNSNGIPDECETDCNNNGIPDDCDIADGTSFDCNCNGVPDECDILNGLDVNGDGFVDTCVLCAGDTNCDGVINYLDMINVWANMGTSGPLGDVNYDGIVNIIDYFIVAWNYGKVCDYLPC